MGSVGTIDRQTRRMVVAFALVAAMIVSSFLPALAWAAQVTERSITMSSSTKGEAGVTYNLKFTAPTAGAGAFVVEFCNNTPLIGEECTPSTIGLGSVASSTSGVSAVTGSGSKVTATKTIAADEDVDVEFTGITNPTATGTVYARILTFANRTLADAYTSEAPGTTIDTGSVAIAVTESVKVSAAVLETLTFCVAGEAGGGGSPLTENCGGASSSLPTIKFGEDVGDGVIALVAGTLYEEPIYTQLSTNASGGAVVRLKSDAAPACGGLMRAGSTVCSIAAAGAASTITAGNPLFGVKMAAATDTGANANGALVAEAPYTTTDYRLRATEATSTYGDTVLTTSGAPVNNKNVEMTFAVSSNSSTPAGKYEANLSLIATGTF